jgi:DNA polymerase-1
VPGVGPKTASALIAEHGSLDAVLAAAETIKKPKLRENLIAHADNARLSRELVRLVCDRPLPEPLDDLKLKGLPPAPLREFLEEMGFKSLLARVGGGHDLAPAAPQPTVAEVEPEFDHKTYECVVTEAALDTWIAEARAEGRVAVDTETTHLDAMRADLVGVSLCTAPARACYVPFGHVGDGLLGETPQQLPRDLVLAKLKPLLEDPSVLKIGQNLKYDLILFRRAGIDIVGHDDTMLLSYALDAGLGGHGMDDLCKKHFSHDTISFKSVCGTGKMKMTFDKVALPQATEYAGEDADVTFRLWRRLRPRLSAEGATRVYEMVDRPLMPVIADMEAAGILVDRAELSRLSADYAVEIARLEGIIHEAAGGPFTIGSPKQLGDVLFERLGLKGGRKGKSGVYSTDVNEMERLAADGVEVATLVLEWRQLTKLKSTYTDALQAQINPNTGRVHTSFSMAVAQTGRLSSTDPNLQNIPIRTELGRRIRDAFVAAPGHVILAADYSQIELRLAAHMADVPELRAAFANGDDIHNLTAQELFGTVDRDSRAKAKTINFAILYGISSWGLAGRLGVDRIEAQAIIDRYFDRFPGVRNYMAATIDQLRDKGFVTTLFGRKTHLPGIKGKTVGERQAAERQAVNAPIQGTSADIIKRAMVRMMPALHEAGLTGTRMLLQVHDELVFEVPEAELDAARPVIERVMAGAAEPHVTLSVPLGVEIGTGASWGAAH